MKCHRNCIAVPDQVKFLLSFWKKRMERWYEAMDHAMDNNELDIDPSWCSTEDPWTYHWTRLIPPLIISRNYRIYFIWWRFQRAHVHKNKQVEIWKIGLNVNRTFQFLYFPLHFATERCRHNNLPCFFSKQPDALWPLWPLWPSQQSSKNSKVLRFTLSMIKALYSQLRIAPRMINSWWFPENQIVG